MKDIYVAFTASKSFYARAIRFLTKSQVNHSLILFKDSNFGDNLFAIQVDRRGVVIVDGNPVLYKDKILTEIYKPKDTNALWDGMCRSMKYIGSKYDWFGILGFLIKLVFMRVLRQNINNPIHRKGELFCSEYVATVLKRGKLKVNNKYFVPENTSPGNLRKEIINDPQWIKVKL